MEVDRASYHQLVSKDVLLSGMSRLRTERQLEQIEFGGRRLSHNRAERLQRG